MLKLLRIIMYHLLNNLFFICTFKFLWRHFYCFSKNSIKTGIVQITYLLAVNRHPSNDMPVLPIRRSFSDRKARSGPQISQEFSGTLASDPRKDGCALGY